MLERFEVYVLGLVTLAVITSYPKVAGQRPDSTHVMAPKSSRFDCSPRNSGTISVRFNELSVRVPGHDSDMVYRRISVNSGHQFYASNATFSLEGTNVAECAKATAREGLEAFAFGDSCTGHRLTQRFLKCPTGDILMYVRKDYFADEVMVVAFDEAPYKLVDILGDGSDVRRLYMLSALVETDNTNPLIYNTRNAGQVDLSQFSYIFLENGEVIQASPFSIDVNFCLNDAAYGLPIYVASPHFCTTMPTVYFLNECGNTIRVPSGEEGISMLIYSHKGVGCSNYPRDAPDECKVTFKSDAAAAQTFAYGFYLSEPEAGCAGLNMTITGSSIQGTTPEAVADACDWSGEMQINGYDTFTVTLLTNPTKPAIGFLATIFQTLQISGCE